MSCRWKLEKYHVKPIVGPIKEKILTDIELEKIEETYKNAQQQDKRYTSTPDE
jgi:hypothetical protein